MEVELFLHFFICRALDLNAAHSPSCSCEWIVSPSPNRFLRHDERCLLAKSADDAVLALKCWPISDFLQPELKCVLEVHDLLLEVLAERDSLTVHELCVELVAVVLFADDASSEVSRRVERRLEALIELRRHGVECVALR